MDSDDNKKIKKRGESVQKRQSRSIHEKKRRIEVNEVLNEMATLLEENDQETDRKKLDKCHVVGAVVDFIRRHTPAENISGPTSSRKKDEEINDCMNILKPLVLVLRGWNIEKVFGNSENIFGWQQGKALLGDIRSYLSPHSAISLMGADQFRWSVTAPSVLVSSIGIVFTWSMFPRDDTTILLLVSQNAELIAMKQQEATPSTSKVEIRSRMVQQRPLLAALLRKDDEETTKSELVDNKPSLGCETPSTSFLSPQSVASTTSTTSHKKAEESKTTRKKAGANRKRLKSVNAIVESFSLDGSKKSAALTSSSNTDRTMTPESCGLTASDALSSAEKNRPASRDSTVSQQLPVLLNYSYDALSPAYKEIWLRLQSERIFLEERVLAKERELQTLMFTSLSCSKPSTSNTTPPIPPTLPSLSVPPSPYHDVPPNWPRNPMYTTWSRTSQPTPTGPIDLSTSKPPSTTNSSSLADQPSSLDKSRHSQ